MYVLEYVQQKYDTVGKLTVNNKRTKIVKRIRKSLLWSVIKVHSSNSSWHMVLFQQINISQDEINGVKTPTSIILYQTNKKERSC